MKKGLLLTLILTFALMFSIFVCAEDYEYKEYVAWMDNEVSLFSANEDGYYLLSEEELSEALELGIVSYYEENCIVELDDAFSVVELDDVEVIKDPNQATYKWDMDMINAYYPREKGTLGKGIKVAVIDSGCNAHVELANNLAQGYNVITNTTDVTDNRNHGTLVSGIIAAEINTVGISGVAPECTLIPIKAFEEDYTTGADLVARAIRLAVDEFACDVINLSVGTAVDSTLLKEAVDYAVGKGVIVVASSGNDGTTAYRYPASYDNVICVGAVDKNKTICSYSQHNDKVTVAAPGGTETDFIVSTSSKNSNGLAGAYGTSFAAPQVTGIAALLKCADKTINQAGMMEIIQKMSADLGTKGYDNYYGYGLADAKAYYNYLKAPLGDCNADSVINIDDVKSIVNQIVKMKNKPYIVKEKVADVDKDGFVTLKDAIIMERHLNDWEGYEVLGN